MNLYHYRPIESALKEIRESTFHFASKQELNDPVEGFVSVYWQADKAAWEGLFRNYVCSLNRFITLYLIDGADEDMLQYKLLIPDLHYYDSIPMGEILRDLGNSFLQNKEIREIAAFYGNHSLKVRAEELRLILYFFHTKALVLCLRKAVDCKTMSKDDLEGILKTLPHIKEKRYPLNLMDPKTLDVRSREVLVKVAEDTLEDMREYQYIGFGLDDDALLYGKKKEKSVANEATARSCQRRNWLSVVIDFPRLYVEELQNMIYPESFVVCFSGKNNDSSMWGNYADNHRGVCLIYETDEQNNLSVCENGHFQKMQAKKVTYGGKAIERNFFESFGRLNCSQIETWLTGVDSKSEMLDVFKNEEKWRNTYWEAYEAKNYRKLIAWQQEDEYRLTVSNAFYSYEDQKSRNLKYDRSTLKGIIFGINTSEYDKKCIMESLAEHAEEYSDFTFYQAEYANDEQTLTVRKKKFWHL